MHVNMPQLTALQPAKRHHMLTCGLEGWQLAEGYLPGVKQELVDSGAVLFDGMTEVKECVMGRVIYDPQSPLKGKFFNYLGTRAVIERIMRKRLLATHGNVSIRWSTRVAGLLHDRSEGRNLVKGVDVLSEGSPVEGDLVIDASGPSSPVPQWLVEGGYAAPRTVKVDPHVGYTFSIVEVPPEVHERIGWKVCYVRPQAPETRGCLVIRIEQGRYQVAAIGYAGDYPPLKYEGFISFIDSLGQADVSEIVHKGRSVLSQGFRGAHNERHYYEDSSLPENLVVIGDAVAHFNPAYGQGITVAALQVEALAGMLKERAGAGVPQLANFSADLQPRIGKAVDFPFSLAIGEDMKYSTTTSSEEFPPSLAKNLFAAYFKQIVIASAHDTAIKLAFVRVISMMDSVNALLAPRVVLSVLASMLRQQATQLFAGFGKGSQGSATEVPGQEA